eukprot:CAMPEP_0174848272 /NCGR_PEP_ID=MMETSP1114-20130205/13425_1 /TAXON_ID=312471 /ORGANISM="Neobodo designis, Strain CCAP 1951/1" /LENGTH=89 /DNA_ID=CAMNT_0016082571 /DNA_START=86 /DNA_END=352 /DNA_ORIENTATION=-
MDDCRGFGGPPNAPGRDGRRCRKLTVVGAAVGAGPPWPGSSVSGADGLAWSPTTEMAAPKFTVTASGGVAAAPGHGYAHHSAVSNNAVA